MDELEEPKPHPSSFSGDHPAASSQPPLFENITDMGDEEVERKHDDNSDGSDDDDGDRGLREETKSQATKTASSSSSSVAERSIKNDDVTPANMKNGGLDEKNDDSQLTRKKPKNKKKIGQQQ